VEITDIQIKLAERGSEKLRAFATVTLDGCFVVHDLKIITGVRGLFVSMPSRKLTARCPRCRCKNDLRSKYCNECGKKLSPRRLPADERGRPKLHADIAHPINRHCRESMQSMILAAFEQELKRSKQEGYEPPRDEFMDAGPGDYDELGGECDGTGLAAEGSESSVEAKEDDEPPGAPPAGGAGNDGSDMGIFQ